MHNKRGPLLLQRASQLVKNRITFDVLVGAIIDRP